MRPVPFPSNGHITKTEANRCHAIFEPLLRSRGATPHEASSARAKAKLLADRLGLSLGDFVPRPKAAPQDDIRRAAEAEMVRRAREAAEHYRKLEEARINAILARLPFSLASMADIFRTFWASEGVTAREIADLNSLEEHTVRAMISRLRAAGVPITATRVGRRAVYRWTGMKKAT